jgi:hypothetical protein
MWNTATPGTFDISSNFSIRIPNEAIAPIPSLRVVSPAFQCTDCGWIDFGAWQVQTHCRQKHFAVIVAETGEMPEDVVVISVIIDDSRNLRLSSQL